MGSHLHARLKVVAHFHLWTDGSCTALLAIFAVNLFSSPTPNLPPRLNQKLSPADELSRSAKENLLIPTHGLDTARGVNPHRRSSSLGCDGSDRGSARARARRLGLSHSPL